MLRRALVYDAKGQPLGQEHVTTSNDWDQIEEWAHKVYMPYRVTPLGQLIKPNSDMRSTMIGRITVTRFAYGIGVNTTDWSQDAGNAIVLTTIGGKARHKIGNGEEVETYNGRSFVVDCSRTDYDGDFDPDHLQFNFTIPHAVLEQTCFDWFGFTPGDALWQHKCAIGGENSSWMALMNYVAACIIETPDKLAHEQAGRHLEQTICVHLLNEWAARAGLDLADPGHTLAPRHVRLAESYMADHAAEMPRMNEVAAAAGTSIRSLNSAFKQFRNYTPSAFLREQRLQGVHRDLTNGNPGITVTQVAMHWGFLSLGEFARVYRGRFGELPSQTLRR